MKQIKTKFERSLWFLITIPISLLIWGYFAYTNVEPDRCLYKVSTRGVIHGEDSKYFPLVAGPCHGSYSEAEEYRLERVEQ